jgi:hypothetical protein
VGELLLLLGLWDGTGNNQSCQVWMYITFWMWISEPESQDQTNQVPMFSIMNYIAWKTRLKEVDLSCLDHSYLERSGIRSCT